MSSEIELYKTKSIVADGRGVKLTSLDELMRFCQIVATSKLAPRGFDTPEAIFVAVQAGLEVGLSPMQSLQNIAVINGRPNIWGDAALALVMSRSDCVDVVETFEGSGEDWEAVCMIQRANKSPVVTRFGYKDAKRAGLWGKAGPWTQYPKRMLQMRARSWAIRDAFPDALRGVGIVEEWRDIQTASVEPSKLITNKPQVRLILPDEDNSKANEVEVFKEVITDVSGGRTVNEEGEFIF